MNLIDWIGNAGEMVNARWEKEIDSESYTEEEARVAAVFTRIDTGINAHMLTYNAGTLNSIKIGVWAIVILSAADFILKLL